MPTLRDPVTHRRDVDVASSSNALTEDETHDAQK